MVELYLNPKWILVEFLRKNLVDPRESRRPSLKVIEFTATADQKEFDLTYSEGKSLSYIEKVEVEGAVKKKWTFYCIDFRNNKIIFYEGLNAGDEVRVELYESETNWIYWDTLKRDLSPEQYPRIALHIVAGSSLRMGSFDAPIESTFTTQFDVNCKEKARDQIFKIDDKNYTGEELAERIAYDIFKCFDEKVEELHPILYDFLPLQFPPRSIPFDEEIQCHKKIVEGQFKGIKLGRIEVK